jgi:hypothetical protein
MKVWEMKEMESYYLWDREFLHGMVKKFSRWVLVV